MSNPGADPAGIVAALDARARHVRTPCGEGRMVWRVWGQGRDSGPPLVLLHGGHGSWTHWLRTIDDLARDFQVIAPDMPGYGESDLAPEPHTPDALAAIMAAGLAEVLPAEERFAIAGFSFGGVMGGHVAALMPERIVRLVLVGAGGLALPRPPTPKLVKWRDIPDEAGRREAHRANLGAMMLADPGAIDALAIHLQSENTRRARRVSRTVSLSDALRRKLERVPVPLAGLWGGRDAMTGAYIETRRALIAELDPEAPFVVVPGAGHWLPYERPDAVCAALRSFLARG